MITFWNHTKTAGLLGLLMGLFLAAGYLLGGPAGLLPALIFGGLMNLGAYFFSDRIAVAAMRGKQVDENSAPDLIEMVGRLARNADLPMPKVYVCPQDAPNAFATGRNPKNAAVAVTHGALKLLSYDELEGVMAHELAHVKNRDTLISTVAATIAGVINMVGWIYMFGGGNRDVHPLVMLAFILLAPMAAMVIQMSVSRSREYVADADGASIAGTPHGLINALQKLEGYNRRIPMVEEAPTQNHLFIVQPLSGGGGMWGLAKLFSTHPATADRVAALRQHASA